VEEDDAMSLLKEQFPGNFTVLKVILTTEIDITGMTFFQTKNS
jgi:hypothetical protein